MPQQQLGCKGFDQIASYFNVIRERYDEHNRLLMDTKLNKREQQVQLPESGSTESLGCLDRQLLRQLNEHDATIENVFRAEGQQGAGDSRPISLLSCHSNNDTESVGSAVSNVITGSSSSSSQTDPASTAR